MIPRIMELVSKNYPDNTSVLSQQRTNSLSIMLLKNAANRPGFDWVLGVRADSSDDQRTLWIVTRFGAYMLNAVFPFGAQQIETKAVFL